MVEEGPLEEVSEALVLGVICEMLLPVIVRLKSESGGLLGRWTESRWVVWVAVVMSSAMVVQLHICAVRGV